MKTIDERVADFVGEDRIVDPQRRDTWQRSGAQVLDGRLRRGRQSNRLAVATEPGGQPQQIDAVGQRGSGADGSVKMPTFVRYRTLLPTAAPDQ